MTAGQYTKLFFLNDAAADNYNIIISYIYKLLINNKIGNKRNVIWAILINKLQFFDQKEKHGNSST